MSVEPVVAYFSMEIGLESSIPTYAGGLGVLAGDTLRSAADLEAPLVGVSLLQRRGYFYQRLDAAGRQLEEPVLWPIDDFLEPLDARVAVELEGRSVILRAWRYRIEGITGHEVPVYLLDADGPENTPEHRELTHSLYGGDSRYRLSQEVILGLGGVALLRELGHTGIERFHLNEGHAALIVLALLEQAVPLDASDAAVREALGGVRERCIFTTHTPVPAGHDRFPADLVGRVLGPRRRDRLRALTESDELNLTELALRGAGYVNGVAMRHWQISRSLFPGYPIHSITNGVHVRTWVSPPFEVLYDRYLPDWRRDAFSLRYALSIPKQEIGEAHREAKRALMRYVNRETNAGLDEDRLTIGFARRATAYKRPGLIFEDLERLQRIAEAHGPLQLVFAGKAHPRDSEGKELIRRIVELGAKLGPRVACVFLPNYDMALAKLLCAGADVWLNTPQPPLEASGTSGMKAAVNGVPSLSVLDGWWIEGHAQGLTGWAIGRSPLEAAEPHSQAADAASLYDVLEREILPCFYGTRERYLEIMRYAIALNASFFNSERMLGQYLRGAYRLASA